MTKKKEKQITIRMPKAKLKLWLDVLRLPANQKLQGTGALFNGGPDPYEDERAGYCCLGALQCAVTGGKVDIHADLPSKKWLKKEGITFLDSYGDPSNDPFFPRFGAEASIVNDGQGKSFKQIAQAIESCAVGY